MTLRHSSSNVAVNLCVWCLFAAGLTLAGCTSDTIPLSASNRAVQQESAEKGVDQSARSQSGRPLGRPIVTKSVKGLIKKVAER